MGNGFSCCQFKHSDSNHYQYNESTNNKWPGGPAYWPSSNHAEYDRLAAGYPPTQTFVEHINDREPFDDFEDPSINPSVQPIFLKGVQGINSNGGGGNHRYSRSVSILRNSPKVRHYSSCSSVLLDDSTISQPNLKQAIRALSLAVFFHIRHRNTPNPSDDRYLEIFDESVHPLQKDHSAAELVSREPDHRTIYRFIRTLFCAAQLTAECAIITLVYLERLLSAAEIDLYPANWRRCLLGAILLASKVWDDQAVWNVDYCQILKEAKVEYMNELERKYLELIQFNINVPSSVYARYYFDLRSLLASHDMSQPLLPLSRERAAKHDMTPPVTTESGFLTPRDTVRLKRTFSNHQFSLLRGSPNHIIS